MTPFYLTCLSVAFLILVYLDDTYDYVRPWLAGALLLASLVGLLFGTCP